MKSRDDLFLKHILERIEDIEKSVEGMSEEEFCNDKLLVDATVRRVEIIGEAAKNISEEYKEKHPKTDWKQIAGTRDILVHAYFKVDLELIWDIIQVDLVRLKEEIVK